MVDVDGVGAVVLALPPLEFVPYHNNMLPIDEVAFKIAAVAF